MVKEFKDYNWKNLIPKKEDYFYSDDAFKIAVKNFTNKFSPNEGFLGIKGRKRRSKESAIELMVNEGLCENKEEAENFINSFKNKDIDYIRGDYFPSRYAGERFNLMEFINGEGKAVYFTITGSLHLESLTD